LGKSVVAIKRIFENSSKNVLWFENSSVILHRKGNKTVFKIKYSKMNTEIKKPTTAKKLLAEGLQEQAQQLERSDAKDIANDLGITARLVRMYLRGFTGNIDTGKEILKAARSIIIKRENEIKKLVA